MAKPRRRPPIVSPRRLRPSLHRAVLLLMSLNLSARIAFTRRFCGFSPSSSSSSLFVLPSSVLFVEALANAAGGNMPKSSKKKTKHYAVANGRSRGIFTTWDDCKRQVHGYNGAKYKSFSTRSDAAAYLNQFGAAAASSNPFGGGGGGSSSGGATRPSTTARPSLTGARPGAIGAVAVGASRSSRAASGGVIKSAVLPPGSAAAAARRRRGDAVTTRRSLSTTAASGASSSSSGSGGRRRRRLAPPPRPLLSNELLIEIYFDGGARGNPGIAGAGASIASYRGDDGSTTVTSVRRYCGDRCTNNVAEYTGMLEGLKCAREKVEEFVSDYDNDNDNDGDGRRRQGGGGGGGGAWRVTVDVKGDSNLLVKQMNGEYAVKSKGLKPYFEECRAIASRLATMGASSDDTEMDVRFSHVYRENNKVADALANQAMDERRSWTTVEESFSESSLNSGEEDI